MWGAGVIQLGDLIGVPVPCCRPEGLLVPFKCSRCPVSAATGVGALPSREMALLTTATWAAGKKSKWQGRGSVGVGEGGAGWGWGSGSQGPQPSPYGRGPLRPAGRRLRLVGGPGPCRGRVEVMYAGGWGTVCDDDWDFADARVACREAGCGPALGATGLGHFGYGRGPVLLDNVGCAGTEARLSDCFHLGWGQHNCGHHEDAGALCSGESALCSGEASAGPSRGTYCSAGGAARHGLPGMGGAARRRVLQRRRDKAGSKKWAGSCVRALCGTAA